MNKPLPHYSKDIEVTIEGGYFGDYSRPTTLRMRSTKHNLNLNVAVLSPEHIAEAMDHGLRQLAQKIGEKEVFGSVSW